MTLSQATCPRCATRYPAWRGHICGPPEPPTTQQRADQAENDALTRWIRRHPLSAA